MEKAEAAVRYFSWHKTSICLFMSISPLFCRGFIIDIDGTLIDSNDAHAESLQIALAETGHTYDFEWVRHQIGKGLDQILPQLIGAFTQSEVGKKIAKIKEERFSKKFPHLRAFPAAKELLKVSSALGFANTVASSASRSDLRRLLKKLEIERYVDQPVSSDEIALSKPAPDSLLKALENLKLPPEEVFMVGDTAYDVEAAKKAGVRSIAFRSGGWSDHDLKGATLILDGAQEMLECLKSGCILLRKPYLGTKGESPQVIQK